MKDLGITHLHLLPVYDYASVDETQSDKPQFNWGYDPENYNVPEGSYSTDPYNGVVRVAEMKQMVKALHDNQISVIMDVVYNHVYNASDFCVNQIVPGYFSRVNEDGTYSNGSDCGNDTASERSMVRKYIVDSVKYWADEYHIDGFRFDLVGLIDTETINEVVTEVHKTHPDVIFYGEGWTMDTAVTKDGYKMTTQPNSTDVPGFAFFSDTLRDALKGHVFYTTRKGYVSGAADLADTVKGCFLGQAGDWCTTPAQSINYASCHDNMTLLDRITRSTPGVSEEDRIRMNNLSAAIYMTAQGIPFLQAGEEKEIRHGRTGQRYPRHEKRAPLRREAVAGGAARRGFSPAAKRVIRFSERRSFADRQIRPYALENRCVPVPYYLPSYTGGKRL